MKRSSTLLVTPSPTAREEKADGRTGGRACLSDGWMEEEGERMQRRLRDGPLHRKERAASLARQGCTETQEGIESRRERALKRRTAVSAARLICLTTNSGKKDPFVKRITTSQLLGWECLQRFRNKSEYFDNLQMNSRGYIELN